jgi:hypothetical protein
MKRVARFVFVFAIVIGFLAPVLDAFAGGRGGKSDGGKVDVKGYYRKDGTYVQPHSRSAPDGNPYNNYGFPGNYNPNTGKITGGDPDKYLERYYEKRSNPWLPRTGTDD